MPLFLYTDRKELCVNVSACKKSKYNVKSNNILATDNTENYLVSTTQTQCNAQADVNKEDKVTHTDVICYISAYTSTLKHSF